MKSKLLLLFFGLFSPLFFQAQAMNPVKWDAAYADLDNNEAMITITANIDKHWHIYSQKLTTEGPIPTSFTFTPNGDYATMGKPVEVGGKEEMDKAFDAKLVTFEDKGVFKQKVKRTSPKAFVITVKLEYMTCNDMQCL